MSVISVTEATFEEEVLRSDKPVLIDFYAVWCGPCKMLSPVVDELSEERPDVKFVKIDIDENPALAERFGVMSIPTLAVVRSGETVRTSVGFVPKNSVAALLD